MEITLEQVERLREKAPVSYALAKQALEYSGGNLLDALIYLEEQGAIPREEGAYYSTREEARPAPPPPPAESGPADREDRTPSAKKGRGAGGGRRLLTTLRRWLLDNELEIWRKEKPVTALPVLILLLLVIFAFWAVLLALALGLFFGFRYRFSGPDLEREEINSVMDSVADTAADIGHRVMEELRHDWHSDEPDRQDESKERKE